MGRLARVIEFIRGERNGANLTDTKGDPGGGANIQTEHFGAPGDDGHPLPGDTYAVMSFQRAGSGAAVGYVDPKNRQTALPGERRIYSRNTDGDQVAEVHLTQAGDIIAQNDQGSVQVLETGQITANTGGVSLSLSPDGFVTFFAQKEITIVSNTEIVLTASTEVSINAAVVDINGTKFTNGGAMTANTATIGGIQSETHTHPQGVDSAGDTQQSTGGPQ